MSFYDWSGVMLLETLKGRVWIKKPKKISMKKLEIRHKKRDIYNEWVLPYLKRKLKPKMKSLEVKHETSDTCNFKQSPVTLKSIIERDNTELSEFDIQKGDCECGACENHA